MLKWLLHHRRGSHFFCIFVPMMRCSGLLILMLLAQAAFAQDTLRKFSGSQFPELSPAMGKVVLPAVDSSSLEYKISTVRILKLSQLYYPDYTFSHGYSSPDTSLDNIQNFNPLYSRTAAFQDLGFQGSPSKSLQFDARRKAGFNIGIHYMDPYFFDESSLKLYQAHNSYTAVQYTQGASQLLWLKLTHTQNLKPNLNLGVDFQRLKHDGYYLRTSPSVFNTRLFGHFYGKKYGRYHAFGTAVFNRSDMQESGGFRSDSLFEKVEVPVNIRLTSARNKIANTSYTLLQTYRFGKKGIDVRIKDSTTLETDTLNTFTGRWQIFNRLNYEANRFIYSSKFHDTLLYRNFFYDSLLTMDSLHHRSFSSEQGISFSDDEGILRQHLLLAGRIEYHRLFQKNDGKYHFVNSSVEINWSSDLDLPSARSLRSNFFGIYYFSGYNQGDYRLEWHEQLSKKQNGLFFQASSQKFTQAFVFSHLKSNHLNWTGSLSPSQVISLRGGFQSGLKEIFRVYARFQNVANYVYLDTAVQVQQLKENLDVIQGFIEGTFRLGNFKFYNQIIWQSDNSDVLRLPSICSKHSWYYQKNLKFRNPGKTTGRMLLQTGFDVFYRSEWMADAWNPAARNFHLQDQTKIGNYPQIDAWVAAKVKTVDLYLKLEHANQGLMGARYYTSPHYALYPRSFRFGLLWRFF